MHVQVKLFAMLRQYAGDVKAGTPIDMELTEGASLQDLICKLGIPLEETRIAFVNGIIEELDRKLKEGDQIGIFPPIGGG
jgi:molybdopterin converting factor small subunit